MIDLRQLAIMLDLILELGDLSDDRLALLLLLGVIVTLGHGTKDIVDGLGSTKRLVTLGVTARSTMHVGSQT